MNNDPIVLTIEPDSPQLAFFQIAFGLSDYLLYDKEFLGNSELSGFYFDEMLYNDLMLQFSSAGEGSSTISVTFTKLKFLVSMLDLIAKSLLNDGVSTRMSRLYNRDFSPTGADFKDVEKIYLSGATRFFDGLKRNFSDQPQVLDLIQNLVS